LPAGVNYDTDETLPGAVIKVTEQKLIIKDSTFSNLVNLAPGSLIVQNSDLMIANTTFSANDQVRSHQFFACESCKQSWRLNLAWQQFGQWPTQLAHHASRLSLAAKNTHSTAFVNACLVQHYSTEVEDEVILSQGYVGCFRAGY